MKKWWCLINEVGTSFVSKMCYWYQWLFLPLFFFKSFFLATDKSYSFMKSHSCHISLKTLIKPLGGIHFVSTVLRSFCWFVFDERGSLTKALHYLLLVSAGKALRCSDHLLAMWPCPKDHVSEDPNRPRTKMCEVQAC